MKSVKGSWTPNGTWKASAADAFNQRKVATGRSPHSAVPKANAPSKEQVQLPGPTTIPASATPNGAKSRPDAAPSEQPMTLPAPPWDRLLTTREAAKIMNVSVETVKKWRQRRLRPAYVKYRDGAVRYWLAVVLQFVSDCTIER